MDQETRQEVNGLHSRINELVGRVTVLETNYDHIDRKLSKIENSTTWLLRVVIGGIVLIIVRFIVAGGFNVPGVL